MIPAIHQRYFKHLARSAGEVGPWWDVVLLTASSDRQADSYRREIELRKDRGRIPPGVLYLVVADPGGERIGSGGATLNALRSLHQALGERCAEESWWQRNRVFLVHSGGDSRRLPQYSPSGRLFTAVPASLPGEPASTLFDETLARSTAWAERMTAGLLISSGDVLLSFDAAAIDLDRTGVTGIAMRQPAEVGARHGVYVTDGHSRVYSFLQKPSPSEIRAAGGMLAGETVAVDTGLLRFHPELAAGLSGLSAQAGALPALDLYEHMTMALTGQWRPPAEALPFIRSVAAALEGVPFSCCLVDGEFVHLGTTRAFRTALTSGLLDRAAGQPREPGKPVIIDSVLPADATLGPDAVMIECYIESPLRVDHGAILHGVNGIEDAIGVPEDVVLHQVPVLTREAVRGVVMRVYGVEDDPKLPVESPDATWFGRPVLQALDALSLPSDLVWPGVAPSERSLWNASLFPLLPPEQCWQACKWMLHLPSSFGLADWKRATRLSLRESAKLTDADALAECRRRRARGNWRLTAHSLVQAGADIRPILANPPGVLALAETARALQAEAELLERSGAVETALSHPLPEAASRFYQAAMFFGKAGLTGEAERSEERAFGAVRQAVELGTVQSEEGFLDDREWQFAEVTVSAPPRIDLGGGWSDTPPFCLDWGGSVLNIALELEGSYPIQARVTRLAEPVLRCVAEGAGSVEYRSVEELAAGAEPGSPFAIPRTSVQLSSLLRPGERLSAAFERSGGGLEILTSVRLPMGSGLGTSSILAAAVVQALAKMGGRDLNGHALSDVVMRLEQRMTTGGGWQDQAGGIFPGAKLIHSGPGLRQRLRVHPVDWSADRQREFRERLVLFDTGIQRIAKNLLRQVVGSYLARETSTVQVLHSIKTLALEMGEAMREGEWAHLGRLIDRHWALNQVLDPHTANAPINRLLQHARPYLAGAKLAGAGGGGFMMMLASSPEAALELRRRLPEWEPAGRVRDFRIGGEGLRLSDDGTLSRGLPASTKELY